MDRDLEQWKKEIDEDVHLITRYLRNTDDEDENRPLQFALALKEARRLQSDIYRVAKDVYDIDRDEIDKIGPL